MLLISYKYRIAQGCLALAVAAGIAVTVSAKDGSSQQSPSKDENIFLGENATANYTEVHAQLGLTGEVELVRERFRDGKVRIERQITLNGAGSYVNHGAWKQFSKTGDVVAEGQYNFGQRVGSWTRWIGNDSQLLKEFPFKQFKTPFMSQANFTDGKMDGDWTITDANERKVFSVSLSAGQRNGMATTWLPNGKVFRQMTYHDSVPVGDLLEINKKTGELVKAGTFDDGQRVVTKTEHYPRGRQKKSEIMYLAAKSVVQSPDDFWSNTIAKYEAQGNDVRHGTAKFWYANGQPQQEGSYQNDKKVGTFTYWHANGQVASTGEYRDDQPDGNWVWWYDNGQKSSVGTYQRGSLIGQWRWWDEEGKLTKQKVYDGTETASTGPEVHLDLSNRAAETSRR